MASSLTKSKPYHSLLTARLLFSSNWNGGNQRSSSAPPNRALSTNTNVDCRLIAPITIDSTSDNQKQDSDEASITLAQTLGNKRLASSSLALVDVVNLPEQQQRFLLLPSSKKVFLLFSFISFVDLLTFYC